MKEKPFSKYQILANAVMIIWTLAIILPFILLFMSSITDENTLVANGYSFFPKKFSLASYSYIIKSGGQILKAYGVSIGVTVVGTLLNVLLSALMAYPLSVKNLPGRNVMMFFVFFTMLFNGGIVPSYIMWTGTFHIKDTIFAQLLPNFLLSAWNVMMIRTYFTTSIPDGLYEAAEIDGASQFTIFWKIVLPLGKPILVTMGTFAGLAYWNDWTNGLYYIVKNTGLYNVQPSEPDGTEYSVPDTELQLECDSSCIDHSGNGNPDGNCIRSNSADYADFPVFPEILCKRYRSWRSQRLIQIE